MNRIRRHIGVLLIIIMTLFGLKLGGLEELLMGG